MFVLTLPEGRRAGAGPVPVHRRPVRATGMGISRRSLSTMFCNDCSCLYPAAQAPAPGRHGQASAGHEASGHPAILLWGISISGHRRVLRPVSIGLISFRRRGAVRPRILLGLLERGEQAGRRWQACRRLPRLAYTLLLGLCRSVFDMSSWSPPLASGLGPYHLFALTVFDPITHSCSGHAGQHRLLVAFLCQRQKALEQRRPPCSSMSTSSVSWTPGCGMERRSDDLKASWPA